MADVCNCNQTNQIEHSKKIILALADKLYVCSRLLTCAAERLSWDAERVQVLVKQLTESVTEIE